MCNCTINPITLLVILLRKQFMLNINSALFFLIIVYIYIMERDTQFATGTTSNWIAWPVPATTTLAAWPVRATRDCTHRTERAGITSPSSRHSNRSRFASCQCNFPLSKTDIWSKFQFIDSWWRGAGWWDQKEGEERWWGRGQWEETEGLLI